MGQTHRLQRSDWEEYFVAATKALKGRDVDIEVLAADLGAQTDLHGKRLYGISYDPKDDSLEIDCEGVDHIISHPTEIAIEAEGNSLQSLLVVQGDETRQIVKFGPVPNF